MRTEAFTIVALASLILTLATPQRQSLGAEFRTAKFSFEGKSVACDTYEASEAGDGKPVILLLHGASGPDLPLYREQAQVFSDKGFTTIVIHYFDATRNSQATAENYGAWARLIEAVVKQRSETSAAGARKIFLVGYSLGASVALAAGSQGVPVAAIAEWYGSLPDEFFYTRKGMPPLLILHGMQDNNIPVVNAQQLIKLCAMKHLECESHVYADQGHGFSGQALKDADERTVQFLLKHAPSN